MKKNIGTVDRVIRIIVAIIFAILIFTGLVNGVGLVVLAVLGLYLLLSGIFCFCLLYTIVGIHTLRTKSGVDD